MAPTKATESVEEIIDSRITACHQELAAELGELRKILRNSFPEDEAGLPDFEGHKKYHMQLIRTAKVQEKFWEEMRLDIAKKGTWGLLVILIGLLIIGIQVKLGLGSPLK